MMRYDYRCKVCRKVIEVKHGMNEKYTGKCPRCASGMERVFSSPQFNVEEGPFWPELLNDYHDRKPGRSRLNYAGVDI